MFCLAVEIGRIGRRLSLRVNNEIQTNMTKACKHTPTHLPILPIYTADSYPTEALRAPSTADHLAATFCLAVEIGESEEG